MSGLFVGELGFDFTSVKLTAGTVGDKFATLEQAFLAGVSDPLPSVILGSRFAGSSDGTRYVLENAPAKSPPVVAFRPAKDLDVAALILPSAFGTRVYLAADIASAERWVDVSQMREFYALPQTTRSAQRRGWIERLSAVKSTNWPTGVDLDSANLGRLASPALRLLIAILGTYTVPTKGIDQTGYKGAKTSGVTLPLFSYPLNEPECFLRVIAGREGVLESINAYDLGAGISLGPIQFNAQRATLLKFFRSMELQDPALWQATLGTLGWTTTEVVENGVTRPTLNATLQNGAAIELAGKETDAAVKRVVAFLQSRKPDKASFADINATWRKSVAALCRDIAVWPHAQSLIQEVSARWLRPGLKMLTEAGVPLLDPLRPDRDLFVLKALLLSAYVRYSSSLAPLLRALQPFKTPAAKVAAIQAVLLDAGTPWEGLSMTRRRALSDRLDAQDEEAVAVWETIIKLADGAAPSPAAMMLAASPAPKPLVLLEDDIDIHDLGDIALESYAPSVAPLAASVLSGGGIPRALDVAIPPFAASERQRIEHPLLSASASATAILWNAPRHPTVSGISSQRIAEALSDYVDIAAVAQAVGNKWSGGIDAVLVEAVHQFQRKIFADTSDHDGRAGEASLDALGFFFGRPGLNGVDVANPTAQAHLNTAAIKNRLPKANDNPSAPLAITSENWFSQMLQASFLGYKFRNGIHVGLVRRLRSAERYLLSLTDYTGMTPIQLGVAMGIREHHKGSRPSAATMSMHTFGLATDINYIGNPWVKGADFPAVLRRAALFIEGGKLPAGSAAQMFVGLSSRPTAEIYDTLAGWNNSFTGYLALVDRPIEIGQLITWHQENGTEGIIKIEESLAAATARWRDNVAKDLDALGNDDGFNSRDPRKGFLDLNRNLVIALRDQGCLAWGASDFGPNASGDIMHFDCRNTGIGRIVNRGFAPKERLCP